MTLRTPISILFATLALAPIAAAQQTTLPLWPHALPEPAQTHDPEIDVTTDKDPLINGHRSVRYTNVTNPTITVYPPPAGMKTNGAAALVFPGGGYQRLAWTGEGIDTCAWINSIGMTCVLVKYRVPEQGRYPDNPADLEDAQQAMRLTRAHATEWKIDPTKIGVVGFSAGANLAVLLSTHPNDHHVESTPAAADVNAKLDARPDFAIIVYPAYLAAEPDMTTINPIYAPNEFTPPTFLLQAENDKTYGKNAPVYYQALAAAGISAELHMYATGGHGFGVRPEGKPEQYWTRLATFWLRGMEMIPAMVNRPADTSAPLATPPLPPCPPPDLAPPSGKPRKPNAPLSNNTSTPDVPCQQTQ